MKFLCAHECSGEHHLIIDDAENLSRVVINRISNIIDSGAKPILINKNLAVQAMNSALFNQQELEIVQKEVELGDLETFGRCDVDNVVDRVFVTMRSDGPIKTQLYERCKRLRIPINTTNSSELSTFSMLSTYKKGDFQMGVTTTHQSCKLANRIKREIVQKLPENLDQIIYNIGQLKRSIQFRDSEDEDILDDIKDVKRPRWLSQIIEYYPLSKLADISVSDLTDAYSNSPVVSSRDGAKHGRISLIGSGPGSLSMLTVGALHEIYNADLVLADKLVPQQILDIIPKKTEVFIARKFPGNAENAQQELLNIGLQNLQQGKQIVRLKQGDPYIFGRGGEEYGFFAKHGYKPVVMPGLTSALVAPVVATVPTTHRDVADQVLVCTGTGKKGKMPDLPPFQANRTVVFLMSLGKMVDILPLLYEREWPHELPVCVVERASCPDQRIIRTRLGDLIEVLKAVESRPPGLLVTGYSCEVLCQLQPGQKYRIEEGYHETHGTNVSTAITGMIGALGKEKLTA
ncbi:hypothetical protein OGAPHI_000753 [Ogataea philodendri]|uniref:uroporphyrinogen-III C-methyltransferase n=1 Tax=Ogataea philodendri TaxID=1378263 RepID=A0A9P8PFE9_9ASCO|nr:uncharacterized protein OGAPHI_000753 [Ogataea philodendri]KAH3671042.1 hypothetical protein OGAPHI_000753 [Ogataea philodendri]